jgi:hypothetical protein
MTFLECERDLGLDIPTSHLEPCASASAVAASKQALEKIADSAAVGIARAIKLNTRILSSGDGLKSAPAFQFDPSWSYLSRFSGTNSTSEASLISLNFSSADWVYVRVMLARKLSVRFLNVVRCDGFGNTEDLIVVFELHCHFKSPGAMQTVAGRLRRRCRRMSRTIRSRILLRRFCRVSPSPERTPQR